jgi:hypothetical protein
MNDTDMFRAPSFSLGEPFFRVRSGRVVEFRSIVVPCSLGVPVVWDQLPPVVHPPHMHLDPIIILRASPEIV